MLLPREEWGKHDLHTTVNRAALLASLLLGLASVVLMYAGAGGFLTLAGVALFLIFMGWITHISIRAVERQAAQFAEERRDLREDASDEASDGRDQGDPATH